MNRSKRRTLAAIRMDRRKALQIFAVAGGAAALAACSSNNNNNSNSNTSKTTTNNAPATQAAATGGASATSASVPPTPKSIGVSSATSAAPAQKVKTGGTLTIATQRDATNLDSAMSQDVYSGYVQGLVLEPLFIQTNDFKVTGNLVDKVDNPDDKTYIFHLHPGIKFQDGTDFNADAVKWNLQRHIDNDKSVRHTDVTPITQMDVVDPMTLKITLNAAYAPFLSKLTGGAGYMYSPTTYQKDPAKIQQDLTGAGTGSFKFTSWAHDNQIVLDKNPSFWRKDATGGQYPYLDKIVMKPTPDETQRLNALKNGDVDMIESPPPKDIASITQNKDLIYKQIPGLGMNFIMMEVEKDPFTDPRVRQAFAYAIDRQTIAKTVFFDSVVPSDTEIPGTIPGSIVGPYMNRDVSKAKALLQQAGKPTVSFTMQFSNASPTLQQTAELIKDEAKEAGFDISLQPIEFATLVSNGNKGDYQAGMLGWSGNVDPDNFCYPLFKSDAGFNLAHYKNPDTDAMLVQAQQTLDPEKRTALYKQIMQKLADDEPFIIYNWTVLYQCTRANVQNFQLGPSNWPLLYMVWKA
jgi:peptide/nickel transport system substrate-binding protein